MLVALCQTLPLGEPRVQRHLRMGSVLQGYILCISIVLAVYNNRGTRSGSRKRVHVLFFTTTVFNGKIHAPKFLYQIITVHTYIFVRHILHLRHEYITSFKVGIEPDIGLVSYPVEISNSVTGRISIFI